MAPPTVPLRKARASVTGVFFLNGAVFSAWYARIPAIQQNLGLDEGELGIALLGAPVGLLLAQPAVGAIVARRGSRQLVAAAPLYLAAVVLPAVAVNALTLLLALLVVGAANGTLDIAMNAQGVAVERSAETHLFTSLHAAFSFGALAGAALAAVAAGVDISPLPHLAASALGGGVAAAALSPGLLGDEGNPGAPRFARPTRRLAALGVIAFCALLTEGAIFDWSGVYLATETGADDGVAPLGLAVFSGCMGVGRLAGDHVAALSGPAKTAGWGALLSGVGLGLALVSGGATVAIIGFALTGLGLSAVFPLTLRASGHEGPAPGPSLAAVSTIGYAGFLAGPPLIGFLADGVGLRLALILVCVLCIVAAALAPQIGHRAGAEAPPSE
jgi:MFS family permease